MKRSPKTKEAERAARLGQYESQYHGSPIGMAHNLHCLRALRAIDGLRTFADIPKARPEPQDYRPADRPHRRKSPYHRVAGNIGYI
jgi:hypothetical protein